MYCFIKKSNWILNLKNSSLIWDISWREIWYLLKLACVAGFRKGRGRAWLRTRDRARANSKIHLRENSLNEYFKTISHYFRVYSLSGFITAARRTHSSSFSLLSLKFRSRRSFVVKPSTARISSHLSKTGHSSLCLQPAFICLRNTLRSASVQ